MQNSNRLTDTETCSYQRGEGRWKGRNRDTGLRDRRYYI